MTDDPSSSRIVYPPTPVREVVETLHGVVVRDPYRWLEDAGAPETKAWTEAQNACTAAYLAGSPRRGPIGQRLARLLGIGSLGVPTPAGGRYFYERREAGQNHPVLYVRDGAEGEDRALVDPNALSGDGTTALDWYHPSPDGRLLAYGLSQDGTEESVLHLRDVGTGADLPDRIPRTRAADVAWLPDASGFYYTRYPAAGEVPEGQEAYHRKIFFHRRGTDPADDPLVFAPAEKEHWPGVALSPDGRWLVIAVARGFDESDLYLLDRSGGAQPVAVAVGLPALFSGEVVGDRLYLRTNLGDPWYRLYVADPTRPARENWREIVPPTSGTVLEGFVVAGRTLGLLYLERARSRLRLADLDGRGGEEHALPGLGTVFGIGAEWDGDELFYGFSSYTEPPSVYRIDLPSHERALWRRVEADLDSEAYETRQVEYPSRDGTRVTMFVVRRRDARDGPLPTYLTGYGGFNLSMTPAFSRSLFLWLEAGGMLAVPNLRGGGEYGEAWHQDGMLGRKQNTFDDFLAAAEWLVREGLSEPDRLVAAGGSNGGLLAGAALTQRPDLFRAVVIQVPLLDMLRYHRFGIARLWIPEYGSADDPEQLAWLAAYSPYHRVMDGTPYPAVLLATAESDPRVDPLHARKMAARLQAATTSTRPILLRLESKAGHGAGKPLQKVLEELTDVWTFVFEELGLEPGAAP